MSAPRALVIGAGPSGLSAAIGLARAGYQTVVKEQRLRWAGRVCGCFLGPEAARHLEWLGVSSDIRAKAVPVTQTKLTWQRLSMDVPIGGAGQAGFAVSRQTLEEILVQRARQHDVTVERGASPESPSDVRVLAAGRFATVGKTEVMTHVWYGWNAVFSGVRQSPGQMSMHFYPGGYVGVVTFFDGTTNVCGLSLNPDRSRGWSGVFDDARAYSDAFDREIGGAALTGEWRGVGPLPFSTSMRTSDAVLVGDAAAVGDPFMGEGNSRALAAGPMLFEALRSGVPAWRASYQSMWRSAYRPRLRAGAALRWVLERPSLAALAVPMLLKRPALMRRLSPLFHRGYFL